MNTISYSLFEHRAVGPEPMYTVGAVENARLCAELYPDWTCVFYVGASIYYGDPGTVEKLKAFPNVVIMDMTDRPQDWTALMWRFLSLHDEDADRMMFRDCDSRPDAREAAAVAEWVGSGAEFHIMRDHPAHSMRMCAGMWGCTRAGAEKVAPLLGKLGTRYNFIDQTWLAFHVYPVAARSALIHDSADTFNDETPRRFPTPRTPGRFVGQGFRADGSLRLPADALRVTA